MRHISVLQEEVASYFVDIDGLFIDCTLGLGGHTKRIARSNPKIPILAIDKDIQAIDLAKQNLQDLDNEVQYFHGSFSDGVLQAKTKIGAVLADLGVSSLMFDDPKRGASFNSENLDMRMNSLQTLSAYDVVNSYTQRDLERIFKNYGQEKQAKLIAQKIIEQRKKSPIKSAKALSRLIASVKKRHKIHPATLCLQAIRIEVNDELGEIKRLFDNLLHLQTKGSVVGIISFHSLEDLIIKQTFKAWASSCICPHDALRCVCGNNNKKGDIITKKPITPSMQEINKNPRSRSAKLRIFRFA